MFLIQFCPFASSQTRVLYPWSKHLARLLPCWALIGDQHVLGKETEKPLAHFYSLITFTGPQSHLCNHGDADKVTHDYSSMALPDWTAPESLEQRIHQRSLCPCSTSIFLFRMQLCCFLYVLHTCFSFLMLSVPGILPSGWDIHYSLL